MDTIYFISVVNDYDIYNKCYKNNPVINGSDNYKLVDFDNVKENLPVPVRYNSFLDNYDYNNPAWFVFCHPDWELKDMDFEKKINKLSQNNLYSAYGVTHSVIENKVYSFPVGYIQTYMRDGSNAKELNKQLLSSDSNLIKCDTFDCMMIFVHSSLIEKYNLRFDENLKWDLYVEDFCINAKEKYDINSYVLPLNHCHYSNSCYSIIPKSYYLTLSYINKKYPHSLYGGTCSAIGGKSEIYKEATNIDRALYFIRNMSETIVCVGGG